MATRTDVQPCRAGNSEVKPLLHDDEFYAGHPMIIPPRWPNVQNKLGGLIRVGPGELKHAVVPLCFPVRWTRRSRGQFILRPTTWRLFVSFEHPAKQSYRALTLSKPAYDTLPGFYSCYRSLSLHTPLTPSRQAPARSSFHALTRLRQPPIPLTTPPTTPLSGAQKRCACDTIIDISSHRF
jgi:hypothetical protein